MASFLEPIQSMAVIPYDPTLPHVALRAHSEKVVDKAYKRSLEMAKFESRHLSPLPQNWKEKIVRGIAQGLRYLYVDKEVGSKMARVITRNFRHGDYDAAANLFAFKQSLFDDLRAICPDKHLGVMFSEYPIPDYDPARSLKTLHNDELTAQQKEFLNAQNMSKSDFSKEVTAYVFPNTKTGYFKINLFPEMTSGVKTVIDEAMKQVVDADALIIDLRDNYGGSPETVAFLASYFFDSKQVINQIYDRSDDTVTSYYVEPEKLKRRFGEKKPIYILTNEKTFSAGEELAYDLQSTKRGVVIGQRTTGGAHPCRDFVVDDHIFASIPYQKAINPHTNKNWEGIGVLPDHSLEEEIDALTFTRTLIEKG